MLEDPLLLQVKMFLANFTWIRRREYREPYSVCTHFTMETIIAATRNEIRCAAALISFLDSRSHAIVAFETDYGLIYIEPQSGNREYIEVGKQYPSKLAEVNDEARTVSGIRLLWNDNPQLKWLECMECHYVLPTTSIIDICLMCHSTNTRLKSNTDLCK